MKGLLIEKKKKYLNNFFFNSDDPLDNLYYKLIEKILPYVIVFDDFDSFIVQKNKNFFFFIKLFLKKNKASSWN